MNSFYKNIGLYDSLNFDIDMSKSEFEESLKKITYKTNTTFISLIPDNGIPTRFEYLGIINKDDFTIKRRRHFFDFNILHSIIKGNISEENNKTSIIIEFTPLISHFLALVFIPVISLFITIQIMQESTNYFVIALPAILTMVQYFGLKRSIKRDKYDFERELNFIAQKNNQFKNFK
ncbi:hypothetical protein ASG22_15720 [Chryseobacterium sp. Leaf405]|uniref:hypothetical protein n=1 Tax=Chryseobacterium sp. Leaf405 TaxID=1736367 RepID=UPI0006FAF76F|nr:hypothetical protein [Chryseobacterium sp. Leaf405]KQT21603.1 hypothetical protein ASG22_15720 [Chryseobacterium sp. Leaf405]